MRWYLAGNVCSNVGTWLQNTAQILLAFELTRSSSGVALVVAGQFVSPLLLGPYAGVLADRFDRRRLLLVTHFGSALVSAAMAALQAAGSLSLPVLAGGAVLIGVGYTFTLPALAAFVPTLTGPADTQAAMTLHGVSSNAGRALAPVLGGGLVVVAGYGWAFALNALSFVAFAAVLLRLRPRRSGQVQRARLLDGFRAVRADRRIAVLLVMVAVATVATDPPLTLGPSMASEALGTADTVPAYFLSAFGLGTLTASLLPERRMTLRSTAGRLGLLGIAVIAFAVAPSTPVAVAAAALAGAGFLLVGAATQTLLLGRAAPGAAGRVMAVWTIAFAGSRPIATAADAWLAGIAGPRISSAMLALPAVLTATVVVGLRASVRGRVWALRVLRGPLPAAAGK